MYRDVYTMFSYLKQVQRIDIDAPTLYEVPRPYLSLGKGKRKKKLVELQRLFPFAQHVRLGGRVESVLVSAILNES